MKALYLGWRLQLGEDTSKELEDLAYLYLHEIADKLLDHRVPCTLTLTIDCEMVKDLKVEVTVIAAPVGV